MKKRILALLLSIVLVLGLVTVSFAANGTGHKISVKIYKVVLDSSKPLGYQNPELINTITVTCQDSTGHSGYNHSANLKDFYPTNVGAATKDWTGWEFASYYTKGQEQKPFYNWSRDKVNATANVTGSEPYPCSKNFYLVYKDTTPSVETVVLLSHKKPDGHINVKVEFGEGEGKVPLDNIAKRAEEYKPKERVTYKMIKEYIEAKYGFKVHTAYIAEVKRDLGLPMYDAPNAVEELKQPRKHPTVEKVEAIKDALKHFEVI